MTRDDIIENAIGQYVWTCNSLPPAGEHTHSARAFLLGVLVGSLLVLTVAADRLGDRELRDRLVAMADAVRELYCPVLPHNLGGR